MRLPRANFAELRHTRSVELRSEPQESARGLAHSRTLRDKWEPVCAPASWTAPALWRFRLRTHEALRSGFSLIEIMVAVALLAVIIVGLMATFYHVQRAFRSGTAQSDVMESGRAFMGVITRELQEISATGLVSETNFFSALRDGPNELLLSASPPVTYRTNQMHAVFFISRQNDDVVGTAYRVETLTRAGLAGTLTRFSTNITAQELSLAQTNVAFVSSILQDAVLNPANYPFHRVMDGVVHFHLVPYVNRGDINSYTNSLLLTPWVATTNEIVFNDNFSYAFLENTLPAALDVELAVLEPATYEKFKYRAQTESNSPPYPKTFEYYDKQAPRIHVFRQRVPIRPAMAESREAP